MKIRLTPVSIELNEEQLLAAGLLDGGFRPAQGKAVRDTLDARVEQAIEEYLGEIDDKIKAITEPNEG